MMSLFAKPLTDLKDSLVRSHAKAFNPKRKAMIVVKTFCDGSIIGALAMIYMKCVEVSRNLLCYGIIGILGGCKCLPVPDQDTTPPTAGLTIEWRSPGGETKSQTFTEGDADITIRASKDRVIVVLYSGGDAEGLKSVKLSYDMSRNTGTSIIQPLLVPIEVVVNCPKKALLESHNFEPAGLPWKYEFETVSRNWIGNETRSARITVRTE